MNKQQLINTFRELELDYLDYDGYNEIEFHDKDETYDLYISMFEVFIVPIFRKLKQSDYDYEHVIFNYFYIDDETHEIMGAFYNPQVHVQLSNVKDYQNEIKNVISLIE